MLAAESYRIRLETGLSFIEFNYMLLQAYDFLYLFQKQGCLFQMGGNDQWGNIVAGIDLIRRVEGKQAYGITFPLITTSLGTKMGKTEKGTVWLDGMLTSPPRILPVLDQFDRRRCGAVHGPLHLPAHRGGPGGSQAQRCRSQQGQVGSRLRGYEGDPRGRGGRGGLAGRIGGLRDEARRAIALSLEHDPREKAEADVSSIPAVERRREGLQDGIPAFELFHEAGLCKSRGEARRNLEQGGGYVNGEPIKTFDERIGLNFFFLVSY